MNNDKKLDDKKCSRFAHQMSPLVHEGFLCLLSTSGLPCDEVNDWCVALSSTLFQMHLLAELGILVLRFLLCFTKQKEVH